MKYTKLLSLFLIMHAINTNSMHGLLANRYEKKPRNHRSNKILLVPRQENQIKKNPQIPAELCPIIKEKIFTIPFFLSQCSSLEEAGQCLCNLAATNRFLNNLVNDCETTLAGIKQLSQQFGDTNIDVAWKLCTQGAQQRYILQNGLQFGSFYEKHLNKIKKCGLDLNFSYDKDFPSPLLQCCRNLDRFFMSSIAYWLMNNGGDINVCTPEGKNPCMLLMTSEFASRFFTDEFLRQKDFKPNHQDNNGETVLHCYLYSIIDGKLGFAFGVMCSTITEMLAKGVNSTLVNNKGETPLMVAKRIKEEAVRNPIVELLEQAEIDYQKITSAVKNLDGNDK